MHPQGPSRPVSAAAPAAAPTPAATVANVQLFSPAAAATVASDPVAPSQPAGIPQRDTSPSPGAGPVPAPTSPVELKRLPPVTATPEHAANPVVAEMQVVAVAPTQDPVVSGAEPRAAVVAPAPANSDEAAATATVAAQ